MMQTIELETMRVELDGPLARLRMNRPEVLNAANWQWVKDLVTATDHLAHSTETHVVIVSGEGRAFCSGLDTKELAQGHLTTDWFVTWEQGVIALENLNAITIAAIQGYCLGGGLQVALACDLRIATSDAVLSIPAVKEGVVAALGPMRLARLIGTAPAKHLCLLGHRFSTDEGFALRLINEVVRPDSLEERALALAEELLTIPFTALMQTKKQIDAAFDLDTAAHMATLGQVQAACLQSPEHQAVMQEYRQMQKQRNRNKG
jgi:enoyl-CoA hydratase/carnithine racemase